MTAQGMENTSQRHGNDVQHMIMGAWRFSGTTNIARTGQEVFDIEARCDPRFGLATSVKTAHGDWIGLADAERFCRIDRPWRLVYLPWEQDLERNMKIYRKVHELIIPLGVMKTLVGDLAGDKVLHWHKEVGKYRAGALGAAAARARRDEIMAEIGALETMLRLDFKIDDKGQRRLQLSVQFSVIAALLEGRGDYRHGPHSQPHHLVHEDHYDQYPLPIQLRSPPRVICREAVPTTGLFGDLPVQLPTIADQAPAPDDLAAILGDTAHLERDAPLRREERERLRHVDEVERMRQTTMFG